VNEPLCLQLEATIGRAQGAALDAVTRALWAAHAAGQCSDDDATRLDAAIQARRLLERATPRVAGGQGPLKAALTHRRAQRPPVRSVAVERRRRLAASGPMPPALAARFTTSELAVLRIVGDEVQARGWCELCLDAIAARAGVCRSTARNALAQARRLGMVERRERRRAGANSLTNVVTVVDREWLAWLARGRGIGRKALRPTDKGIEKGYPNSSLAPRAVPQPGAFGPSNSHARPRAGGAAASGPRSARC
jgi:hypothetical protein